MKSTLRHAVAAIILVLSFGAPVAAGPLEDGNAAYKRGDYATAMRILRPLAEQGDGMAATIVGLMYYYNFGVPLDYVTAYMWFSLGAAHGNSLGALLLKTVTARMTQREMAQAQKLVREWNPAMRDQNKSPSAFGSEGLGETWSCDVNLMGEHIKTYKQQWTISNGRMAAPRGKGYLRVTINNDRLLVAFTTFKKDAQKFYIIEKKTGTYLELDTLVMTVLGKAYEDTAEPDVTSGHCTLLER